jgi:Response regulator containing CheY-like receiver domain and AraC-type DNA-binding domain
MPSILIVDDEPALRESLAMIISDYYGGAVCIRAVENGERAVAVCCAEPVDLIISDIKMPVMSGLEMMEKLHSLGCKAKVIVISGFDDYSLVRKAMKLGAADYLLKPIIHEELLTHMERFVGQSASEASPPDIHGGGDGRIYYQQYMLERLIAGSGDVCALHIDGLRCLPTVMDVADNTPARGVVKRAWHMEWEEQLLPHAADGCITVQGEWQKQWVVLFFFRHDYQTAVVYTHGRQLLGQRVRIAHGPICEMTELPEALRKASARLEGLFFDLEPLEPTEKFPFPTCIENMVQAAVQLDADGYPKALGNYLRHCCAARPRIEQVRQQLVGSVHSIMQRSSPFIRSVARHELTENDLTSHAHSALTAAGVLENMSRAMAVIMADIRQLSENRDDVRVEQAKAYIREHYAGDLTLSAVAEPLNLHPNYLSNLFLKHSDESYSGYVRKVRIDAACRLIEETPFKLYEIAERVGYPDPVHFNRAFRKQTGMSPSDYKKQPH